MSQEQKPDAEDYRVSREASSEIVAAPDLNFRPTRPRHLNTPIGIIGCGGIAATHCEVYRDAGYKLVAFHDRHPERAEKLRDLFFPSAKVHENLDDFLDSEVQVADITTHPADRVELIEASLHAGKHVLSQKPFALDLQIAKGLVELAESKNRLLAVNQNGRWAPHVCYARQAIEQGLLGEIQSVDMSIYWDHNWCAGTPFDQVRHLLLFDFAIHWFDMLCCYFGERQPETVFAQLARTQSQKTQPGLNGQVLVKMKSDRESKSSDGLSGAPQASLVFRGDSKLCPLDRTVIIGSEGTLVSEGPNLNEQRVELHRGEGVARPSFDTAWFNDGFDGTLSELLCAIEQKRQPIHSARNNLKTLELCFAAVESAESGQSVPVGKTRKMPQV